MAKNFKFALLWAIKADAKQALEATIQRIIAAGYTQEDINKAMNEIEIA